MDAIKPLDEAPIPHVAILGHRDRYITIVPGHHGCSEDSAGTHPDSDPTACPLHQWRVFDLRSQPRRRLPSGKGDDQPSEAREPLRVP